MSLFIALVACAVLFVVPVLFVWNEVYEDGFWGRLGLTGISFSAMVMGVKIYQNGFAWHETTILLVSFAIFLTWHLVRFHTRVLTNKRAEKHEIDRRRKVNGMC